MLYFLLTLLPIVSYGLDTDAYILNPDKQYKCSDPNLDIAITLRADYKNDPKFKKYLNVNDKFIGYPEGQCGFVKTQESCKANGNIDFLKLYYC